MPSTGGLSPEAIARINNSTNKGSALLQELGADVSAFKELAALRAAAGRPAMGEPLWEKSAFGRLDVVDLGGVIHTFSTNNKSRPGWSRGGVVGATSLQAEGAAFDRMMTEGVAAKSGVWWVDRSLCGWCGASGGIGSLLRQSGMEVLTVVSTDGVFQITAGKPSVPIEIWKRGG